MTQDRRNEIIHGKAQDVSLEEMLALFEYQKIETEEIERKRVEDIAKITENINKLCNTFYKNQYDANMETYKIGQEQIVKNNKNKPKYKETLDDYTDYFKLDAKGKSNEDNDI